MNYPKPQILSDAIEPNSAVIGRAWYVSVPEYHSRQVTELLQQQKSGSILRPGSTIGNLFFEDVEEYEEGWINGQGPVRMPRINDPNSRGILGEMRMKDKFIFLVLMFILGIVAFGIYKHVREKLSRSPDQ